MLRRVLRPGWRRLSRPLLVRLLRLLWLLWLLWLLLLLVGVGQRLRLRLLLVLLLVLHGCVWERHGLPWRVRTATRRGPCVGSHQRTHVIRERLRRCGVGMGR